MADKTTVKRRIAPIVISFEVEVNRINENGTLSGVKFLSAKAKDAKLTGLKISAPPQGGGAMYAKVEALDGIKLLADDAPAASAPAKKLF